MGQQVKSDENLKRIGPVTKISKNSSN